MPEISAKAWSRFAVTNFCVTAEVMGLVHEFDFGNHRIVVKLPPLTAADRDGDIYDVASAKSWSAGTNEVLSCSVRMVDVEVILPEKVSIPKEALSLPPKQLRYFSSDQWRAADSLCEQYSEIAKSAFEYWLDITRWATDNAYIGQPEITDTGPGSSVHLREFSSGHPVWIGTTKISVRMESEMTKCHWTKASEHLQHGDEMPMHRRFLYDAENSTRNRQYEKAIIELAMACELYLRYSVFEFIPEDTPEQLREYIEEANLNQYSNRLFKSLVSSDQMPKYLRVKKDLSSLASKRNTFLHMGTSDADEALCRRFIGTARELFSICLNDEKREN